MKVVVPPKPFVPNPTDTPATLLIVASPAPALSLNSVPPPKAAATRPPSLRMSAPPALALPLKRVLPPPWSGWAAKSPPWLTMRADEAVELALKKRSAACRRSGRGALVDDLRRARIGLEPGPGAEVHPRSQGAGGGATAHRNRGLSGRRVGVKAGFRTQQAGHPAATELQRRTGRRGTVEEAHLASRHVGKRRRAVDLEQRTAGVGLIEELDHAARGPCGSAAAHNEVGIAGGGALAEQGVGRRGRRRRGRRGCRSWRRRRCCRRRIACGRPRCR